MRTKSPIMQTIPIDIVGSSTFGRYPIISNARTFNMIISDNSLVSFAGYAKKATIKQGAVSGRELYRSIKFNHMISVIDDDVFTIDNNLGIAKIGKLNTSIGNIYTAENDNNQIALVDGQNIYVFDYSTNSFTVVVVNFLPGFITFQDGYFISVDTLSNKWRLSAPNNGLSWPDAPANVGLLESKPDIAAAVITLGRQLFVFGSTVTEPWYDSGYQLFPYSRSNFYNINYGVLSPATIASEFNILCWLAANESSGPIIMASTGGQPEEISTDGINFELAQLQNPKDSFGLLYKIDGHIIYQLTFISDNRTFSYDFKTQKFFEFTDENQNYHIARKIAYFENSYYFISVNDGNLYELNSQYTTYDDHIIPRIRTCSNNSLPDGSLMVVNNVNATFEQGYSEDEYRVDLSVSHDGGASFSSYVPYYLHSLGNRRGKVDFWNLGASNDFATQFRFWTSGRVVATTANMSVYQ